ncbi:DUF4157 domain-containing protein [Paraflavitalea soli]|uniref:DUF4157 domain-containing protein n=1 Tax=Paraflavitalea soli TaxID=2315862 RepID=A0A3B7MKG7_9BACT|nr:DUF4157 domain-containing protein [Paraflavitalea soli]AXY73793.1 DUF4157 domain-containing protein [Paraflavitalea soli]
MFASADKTTRHSQVQQKAADPAAFLQRKAEPAFFGGKQNEPFFSPSALIQTKLSISQPNDPHEREADAIAERVMTMPEPASAAVPAPAPVGETEREVQKQEDDLAPMPAMEIAPKLQCKEEKEEEKKIQPKLSDSILRKDDETGVEVKEPAIPELPALITIDRKIRGPCLPTIIQRQGRAPPTPHHSFESSLQSTKGSGSPLPDSTRSFMENRFGADFSGVRIHTGSTAVQLNREVHAQAFAHGNDVYFNSGKYAPHTPDGGFLLAHELTHTIQQGASKTLSPTAIAAKRQTIYRQAADASPPRISNLDAAVNIAKGEIGKVDAGTLGPDGFRTGWDRLVDYFQTSFGSERILAEGAPYKPGTVNIAHIKNRKIISGMKPNQPDPTVRENRDAMPSWCGIFVFWALNKAGLPMPKWVLGKAPVNPAAAYPKGYAPRPGDIAYRNKLSHFAMVEKTEGTDVYTVNGNTAGENNLGGQIQVKKHALKDWTAFFDPLYGIDPNSVSAPAMAARPKTLQQLQQEIFGTVQRMEEAGEEMTAESSEQAATVQTKPETGSLEVNAAGKLQTIAPTVPAVQTKQKPPASAAPETQEKDKLSIEAPSPVPGLQRMMDTGPPAAPITGISGGRSGDIIQCSFLDDAMAHIVDFLSDIPITLDIDVAKGWLLGKVRQLLSYIPGYRALGVILGYDPVTSYRIERNGRNFIEAALDILPGGSMLQRKLEELGALDRAAAWLDTQLAGIEAIVANVRNEFFTAWEALGVRNILDGPTAILRNFGSIIERAINNIVRFAVTAAEQLLSMVKEYLINQLVTFIREQTPAYPLLRVVLGKDPVTEEEVPRNGTNILNAMLELSEAGREQRRQMQDTGTFERVAAWIDTGIGIFSGAYEQIINAFHNIWNHVSIDSLMDPVGTFRMIYNEFAAPVGRVLQYMADTAIMILTFIKEVLMRRLSVWARTVRGYPLVTVLLGKDPFTDETVPRSIPNIIRGFMSLVEGGEEQFNQLQESGAIGRTVARINAAVARLNMTPTYIVNLFISLWNSFSINDLANPIAAFQRIIDRFGEPIARLIAFVIEIVRIVIEVILQVMNFPTDLIANIISKAMQAVDMIKRNPVGFLKNLLRAIKQGFIQFFANIGTHLMTGLTAWLMAELRDANVPAPENFTLQGVIRWILQVLGISMEAVWTKLAAHPRIGPQRVARIRSLINTLEGIWTFIRDVQERGIAAIWERIQSQLTQLWDTVLNAIKTWIMERIINAVTTRLLSLLDPTGIMAVINSAIALYRAVQSFIRYLRQMLEIVNSFVEGVVEIASGNISTAANFLERTMARAVPIMIGFLANQVGLSGLGRRIGEMVVVARGLVDRALTWLVNRCVDTAFAILDRLLAMGRDAIGGGGTPEERVENAVRDAQTAVNGLSGSRVGRAVLRPILGAIRLRYGLTSLEMERQEGAWMVVGVLNPRRARPVNKEGEPEAATETGEGFLAADGKRYVIQNNVGSLTTFEVPGRFIQNFIPRPGNDIAYVANVPTIPPRENPSPLTPSSIAQLYREGAFDNAEDLKSRFALIIGVNAYRDLKGEKEPQVSAQVSGFNWTAYSLGLFGMSWVPRWCEERRNGDSRSLVEVTDFSIVRNAYNTCSDKAAAEAYERSKIVQRTIPYGLIRDKIRSHPFTNEAVSALQAWSRTAYIHTGDPDAVNLRATPGGIDQNGLRQKSSAFANGLFDRYDQIIRESEARSAGIAPAIVSGGYEFRLQLEGGDVAISQQLTYLASQLDIAIRERIARINTTVVYFPEPNTAFRVDAVVSATRKSATLFGTRAQEGATAVRRILRTRPTGEVLFDSRARLATRSDRFAVGSEGAGSFSLEDGILDRLTVQGIKTIVAQEQSHADVTDFIRRIKEAYPGSRDMSAEYTRQLNLLYANYVAIERLANDATLDALRAELARAAPDFDMSGISACLVTSTPQSLTQIKQIAIEISRTIAQFIRRYI